jgi:hypothetical protein
MQMEVSTSLNRVIQCDIFREFPRKLSVKSDFIYTYSYCISFITCFVGCAMGSIFQKQGSMGNDIRSLLWKLGSLHLLVLATNIL